MQNGIDQTVRVLWADHDIEYTGDHDPITLYTKVYFTTKVDPVEHEQLYILNTRTRRQEFLEFATVKKTIQDPTAENVQLESVQVLKGNRKITKLFWKLRTCVALRFTAAGIIELALLWRDQGLGDSVMDRKCSDILIY